MGQYLTEKKIERPMGYFHIFMPHFAHTECKKPEKDQQIRKICFAKNYLVRNCTMYLYTEQTDLAVFCPFSIACLFTFTVNVHTNLALEAKKGLVLANIIGWN